MGRKPGVMEPDELRKFVEQAGDKLIVVDARNPGIAVEEAGDRRPRTTCWQTASRTSPTAAGPRTPSAGPSLAASKERRAARASVASSLSRGPVVLSVGVRCTSCGYLGQLPHRVLRRRRLVITNAAK